MVVKRPAEERKKLPPELEAFARSQDDKLRIPRARGDQGRVRDPREGFTIAGVANRDARAVYDARSGAMRALWAEGQAGEAELLELGALLHDALRLSLWRARRVTDFAAYAEEVIGLPAARARALAEAHAERVGESLEALNERTVAAWLRTEAGLYEGDERARVRLRSAPARAAGAAQELEIRVSLAGASLALAGAGARHAPLAREQNEALAQAAAQGGRAGAEGPRPAGGAVTKPGVRLLTRRQGEPASDAGEVESPRRAFGRGASGWGRERDQEPADERRARGERRGFADKRAPGESRAADGGRAFGERRGAGGKRGFGEKRGFAGKRGFERGAGEKRGFGDSRAGREARGSGAQRGSGEERASRSFGERRGPGEKREFGDKRGFGEKRAYGEARGFREQRPRAEQDFEPSGRAFSGKRGGGGGKRAGLAQERTQPGQKPRFDKRGGAPGKGAGKRFEARGASAGRETQRGDAQRQARRSDDAGDE